MIKHSQKGKLPAVFPMVLYNGLKPWTIPRDIREAVDGGVIPENYLLKGEYYLLDENRVAEETLLELHNLAAAVIYYEKHRQRDDLNLAMSRMMDLLANEDFNEIRQVLLWAVRISGKGFDEKDINKLRTLQEGKRYMEAMTSQWEQNIRKKALEEGLEEGLKEGLQQGLQKGKRQEQYSVARSLKLKGFETSLICEVTGLSKEEVLSIDPKKP